MKREIIAMENEVLEQAAHWQLRINADDLLRHSDEFQNWLLADVRHAEAWQQIQSTWHTFTPHQSSPILQEIRRDALSRAQQGLRQRWNVSGRFSNYLAHHWRAFAAASTLLVAGMVVLLLLQARDIRYETTIGERRMVTLVDGSRVLLDSDCLVRVDYSQHTRQLYLERGRARFDVSHDATRPFVVTSAGRTVTAVGTAFNVETLRDQLIVTLLQGRVMVGELADRQTVPVAAINLEADQQLVVERTWRPIVTGVDHDEAMAWESGQLIFKQESLANAIARINRYTRQPLQVSDAAAGLKISGVFNAGDTMAFVDAVTQYLPVQAVVRPGQQISLQLRT
ncbi:MAG: FecR domain-containing protein [Steroidobacteraceae bacterium]